MVDRRVSQLDDGFVRADLEQMSRAANYLEYQYGIIEPYLGKRILEIGSGIGNITGRMLPGAELVVGLEPNESCYLEIQAKLGGNESLILIHGTMDQCRIEDLQAHRIDTIICINVLEHIKYDEAAVKKFFSVLAPEGRLILVVPSPSWAYGVIDRAVGHFRRYSKTPITNLVKNIGFTVECCRYYNPIGLLGWIINSKITRRVKQSDMQIYVFDRFIVPFQSLIEKAVKFPIGQSLLLVANKR